MLNLSEIYSSIQGEGLLLGKPVLFIRLSGCNLKCGFCDSKYHTEGAFTVKRDALITQIRTQSLKDICFTGGEPTLQLKSILKIIDALDTKYSFHLETNGTKFLKLKHADRFSTIAVSPKLSSAGVSVDLKEIIAHWKAVSKVLQHRTKVFFKFVVGTLEDRRQLAILFNSEYSFNTTMAEELRDVTIVFQPQTEQNEWKKKYADFVDWVIQTGQWSDLDVRFMPRWHVDLWGKERKR